MKTIEFGKDEAILTITDGPIKGSYFVSAMDLESMVDGFLDLHKTIWIDGKERAVKVKVSDAKGIEGLAGWLKQQEEEISQPKPCECSRCRVELSIEKVTMRRVRVGGIVAPVPFCGVCASLMEEEVEFADATPYHKNGDE